jgi:3-hydroxyisobutyrate dehydrogenase-like beta-hydroxyacid dehydrogenase
MKISVFGLGYLGAATAGSLAGRGHHANGAERFPEPTADGVHEP